MQSGLLSSLFRDNSSAHRSTSLFQKNLQESNSLANSRARSQSNNRNRITDYSGANKNIPLYRMNITLAQKIMLLKRTAFYKLQKFNKSQTVIKSDCSKQLLDNDQTNGTLSLSKLQESQQISQMKSQSQQICIKRQNLQQKLQEFSTVLCMMRERHYRMRQTQLSFKLIKRKSSKVEAILKLQQIILLKNKGQIFKSFIQKLSQNQQMNLKVQISVQTFHNILIRPILEQFWLRVCSFTFEKSQLDQSYKIDICHLNSIQQQNSSLSEEETARFNKFFTPQKPEQITFRTARKSEGKDSRTKRKQPFRNARNKFGNYKQDQGSFFKNQQDLIQAQSPKIEIKNKTKIQSIRPKINMGGAFMIQTQMSTETNLILKTNQKEFDEQMTKHNHLYGQTLYEQIPDICDHHGIFEQSGSKYSSQSVQIEEETVPTSFRSLEENKHINTRQLLVSHSKTVDHPRITQQSECEEINYCSSAQYRNQNPDSPKFKQDNMRYTSHSINNIQRIEEMMLELQKIQHQEKFNKYSLASGIYPRNKVMVKTPYKKQYPVNKSYQSSASKKKYSLQQSKSQKRYGQTRQLFGRFQNKPPQQKQNIQIRLKNQCIKNPLYQPSQKRYSQVRKKHSVGTISITDQSLLSTARKMKKQIQSMINGRKSIHSLSHIKMTRSKH